MNNILIILIVFILLLIISYIIYNILNKSNSSGKNVPPPNPPVPPPNPPVLTPDSVTYYNNVEKTFGVYFDVVSVLSLGKSKNTNLDNIKKITVASMLAFAKSQYKNDIITAQNNLYPFTNKGVSDLANKAGFNNSYLSSLKLNTTNLYYVGILIENEKCILFNFDFSNPYMYIIIIYNNGTYSSISTDELTCNGDGTLTDSNGIKIKNIDLNSYLFNIIPPNNQCNYLFNSTNKYILYPQVDGIILGIDNNFNGYLLHKPSIPADLTSLSSVQIPKCAPCGNNGDCMAGGVCVCKKGFSGPTCETNITP